MKRLGIAGIALVVVFLTMVGATWAETTTTICVPEASSKPVLSTNTKGECPPKGSKPVTYKAVQLPGTGGLEALNKILPHVNYVEGGVGGKPTIQFSGVNVQVVNGEGKTASVNGEGNLIIGYDENPEERSQAGSHNLVLGERQLFASYGGIIGGWDSTVEGAFAFDVGRGNVVTGNYSSVSGGGGNTANGDSASVSGGSGNYAKGHLSSVSGGISNEATSSSGSWVSGGQFNISAGIDASVSGGFKNTASGKYASIFGGKELTAPNEYEAIP